MSFLDRFRRTSPEPEPATETVEVTPEPEATHQSAADWVFADSFTTVTLSLPRITSDTLLRIPAAYDAINVLVRPIKTLPLVFFERRIEKASNGQERVVKHRVEDNAIRDLLRAPNGWQDRLEFLEFMLRALVIHYNAYAEIIDRGERVELWPIDPRFVDVEFSNGVVQYRVTDGGKQRIITADRIWHMKVGPFDAHGIAGIGPLITNQEVLQSALAVIEYGGRFFGNDASPSGGYWKAPSTLSDQARKNLETSLRGALGGPNQHRTKVTEEGLEFVSVNLPNDKAQFIETKRHDTIEISRLWSIPPHKIKALENATFSNIEQQAIEFVVYSLAPWLSAVESSIKTHLIGLDNPVFAEFNVLGLLRGDTKARFEAYAIGRNWGWLSVDDVRSLENLNPLPDGQGETYLTPLNMSNAAASDNDTSEE